MLRTPGLHGGQRAELRLLRGCRSRSLLPAVQSCGGTALFSPAPRLMPPSAKTERWSYHLQSVSRWINQACNAPMLQQGHNKQFSKNCADIIRFFFFLNPYYFQLKKSIIIMKMTCIRPQNNLPINNRYWSLNQLWFILPLRYSLWIMLLRAVIANSRLSNIG